MQGEFHELLIRIDERTKNIETRQAETIDGYKSLDRRMGALESWRTFIAGSVGAIGFVVTTGVAYLGKKLNGH